MNTHDNKNQQVDALADQAETIEAERPEPSIEQYQPFPTVLFPQPIRKFVEEGAKAIGCAGAFLALPLLTVLAAAIGNSRRIELKPGWNAPAIIWTVIVGESGTAKSPAFKLVNKPVRDLQQKAFDLYAEEIVQYEADLAIYEKKLSEWRHDKKTTEPPPTKPEPPQAKRFFVSDVTVEALAPILLENPRGLLVIRDELAGWLGSFDKYSGGKGGADAAQWLSMYNGEGITVDRKSGNPPTIYVPDASASITGGIQPSILDRALGNEHRESGLAARLLLACPPRIPRQWTEASIDPSTEAMVAKLIDRLYDLEPNVDDSGKQKPVVVKLTHDAKTAFRAFYNAHNREQAELTGELAAAWSKLEELAARLALVIHFVRWAANDPSLKNCNLVDLESITAGIELVKWFKRETRRVYALLSESKDHREQRRLIEWIGHKGGSVTAREVQQGIREIKTSDDANAALGELAKDGCGQWEPSPPGKTGQPTRRFVLSAASTVYGITLKPEENRNTVDVDSVDAPQTQDDDEWGEV